MNTIWTIIKKELKRYFTDPRMLVTMFLPGILIFVIYTFMGDMMTNVTNPQITEFTISIENQPAELDAFLKVKGWDIVINQENITKEEKIERVKNQDFDVYIVYEENFIEKMAQYNPTSGEQAPQVEIYYNSTSNASNIFYTYYTQALTNFESQLSNKFDINHDTNTKYDTATASDTTVYIISMMLPFLLMTFLFSGSMAICTESIAGEKERGTIATLLITPIKRSDLAFGKIMSLGITGLASSIVSFLGLMLSLPNLAGNAEFDFSSYTPLTFILILLLIFVTVLLFTTMLTIVSTIAKSVKEANSYSAPLMVIIMLVCVTNFMVTTSNSNLLFYIIPVYNVMQCFVGLFSLKFDITSILICIISNIIYISIGIYILAKMFNNEKIMFNK